MRDACAVTWRGCVLLTRVWLFRVYCHGAGSATVGSVSSWFASSVSGRLNRKIDSVVDSIKARRPGGATAGTAATGTDCKK